MSSPHDGAYISAGLTPPSLGSSPPDPADPFGNSLSAAQPDMTLPGFAKELGVGGGIPNPIDIDMSMPQAMDVVDALGQPSLNGTSSPGLLSGFHPPPPLLPSDMLAESIPNHPLTHTSPSATSASTSSFASDPSSPAIQGSVSVPSLSSVYSIQQSNIGSSFDGMHLPGSRSRSASSASPGNLGGNSATIDAITPASLASGLPTSSQSSSYKFPPSEFDGTATDGGDVASGTGPHLMVVDDMLKNIVNTANSARHACTLGHSATAGVKIDELKKTIALVSELIAATRLVDGPSPSSEASPPPPRVSPPRPNRLTSGPFSGTSSTDALTVESGSGMGDGESRKRCASSIDENRVPKALKLEPQDELHPGISVPPAFPSFSAPPTATLSTSNGTNIDPNAATTFPPAAAPASGSRPVSSHGASLHHHPLFHPASLSAGPAASFSSAPLAHPPPLSLTNNPFATSGSGSISAFSHQTDSWVGHSPPFARHQQRHSLSGESLNMKGAAGLELQTVVMNGSASSATFPSAPPGAPGFPPVISETPATVGVSSSTHASLPNLSANPSLSPFAFGSGHPDAAVDERMEVQQSRPTTSAGRSPGSDDEDDEDEDSGNSPRSNDRFYRSRGGSLQNEGGGVARASAGHRRSLISRPSIDGLSGASAAQQLGSQGNEVPQEYKAEVDRIFFEFLNKTCSNLEATDSKGEPIHQTLMAKKMQRLDESPDFRPFKFRIQAFTNAFLEELARQGYPEDKIPMKKIRNYLWNSSYISRFNEDGKKAKSKGNHIWNIEAKKMPEGGWAFRPFHRRLAGLPPGVAYVGLKWQWIPRIWDPQASRANLSVKYSSPSLPAWLVWNGESLEGVPPPDAQSCDVTVEARFMQDGKEELLSQTVHIAIAPMNNVDVTFSSTSRRPSLVSDSRRIQSDSIVPQASATRSQPQILRPQAAAAPSILPVPSHDTQVIQVLTTAAQRVAQEAQSQVVAGGVPVGIGPELQSLAKQQHVLTVTAQAVDKTVSTQGSIGAQPTNVLATAAQHVVLQAARQVAADRSAIAAAQISAGVPPAQTTGSQVTVNEVSVATQSAVAQAVEITGPLSSEVDVLMTASSLLQQQTRVPPPLTQPPPSSTSMPPPVIDPLRPHSTGTLLSRTFGGLAPVAEQPPPTLFPPQHVASSDLVAFPQQL